MCIMGDGGAGAIAAKQQQQADQARADANKRAADIQTGQANIDNAFSAFDDNYFNGISKKYLDYAQPQLDDQYDYAKKNLTYALARNGTTHSSIAGDEFGQLAKQYATNQTGINSNASDVANNLRSQVNSQKASVTNQLLNSADADAASASALAAAKTISATPSFSPLGNLFTNVAALAAQNKLASDSTPSYATGAKLFGGNSGIGYSVG